NNKIYIISDSSPKIYNNTFIAGTGNASRYIISISGSSGCHPTLKNNLLVDLASDVGGNPGLYHMNNGVGTPYCYTTNLFYLYPNASGDGSFIFYNTNDSRNINGLNVGSRTADIYPSGSQLLTYNDPAWRNLVNQNPLFVNPAANDYHLQASSPARAAGTDLSAEIPAVDRDGNPRTAPWSIGAYERD
ncbi:MAG: hypothetical protein N2442_06650, partial [Spirochaetes bacterium]|nr:hypothetical protein [Spirochaetota bacterium]